MISQKQILIVEDNEINRMLLGEILSADYQGIEAENGLEALSVLKERGDVISLILLDITMPVMDGYTARKKIRSLERSDAKTIPIIAMTANAFQEDAEKCIAVGMNAHLAKPLDIEKVMITICHLVKKKNSITIY